MQQKTFLLIDETATIAMGKALSTVVKQVLKRGVVVYLNGELGAGKTTLTRGFVQGMGHVGNVKSPTYTLVEPYEIDDWCVYHFDLYRLSDPEELEYMGIRDYFGDKNSCFIEWPEKGYGLLAEADITINIEYNNEQRNITFTVNSELGSRALTALVNIVEEKT
ncbi:tRNA (adenosine(37)-N6)-threonylcarbamoyltransferase complex ATPase subunit type 1 TsaE [Colwelliaceae bacterium 6471]